MIDFINDYDKDDELQKIITYLKDTFNKDSEIIPQIIETPKPTIPEYEQLGWNKVESRSRPGEFSYENKYTGERIPDQPKYEASKLENKSKDLLEYE